MRLISISYARLTSAPAVSFDPATGEGSISTTYVVGEVIPEVIHDDGSVTAQQYRDHPTCTNAGSVSIPLGPTDTAGVKFQAMVLEICALEGLDLQAGDQVITA